MPTYPLVAAHQLSPLELELAQLVRAGMGRNACAAALKLSPNSVKTMLRRIRVKLGEGWKSDPRIRWPDYEVAVTVETYILDETNQSERFIEPELTVQDQIAQEQQRWENRGLDRMILIAQSRPGSDVYHVSGAQRFWLRPALEKLIRSRHLRLLGVDWHELYEPPWLPLINRGRRVVRAAHYSCRNARLVQGTLEDYLQHDLPGYLNVLCARLHQVRNAAGERSSGIPRDTELANHALTEMGLNWMQNLIQLNNCDNDH